MNEACYFMGTFAEKEKKKIQVTTGTEDLCNAVLRHSGFKTQQKK